MNHRTIVGTKDPPEIRLKIMFSIFCDPMRGSTYRPRKAQLCFRFLATRFVAQRTENRCMERREPPSEADRPRAQRAEN